MAENDQQTTAKDNARSGTAKSRPGGDRSGPSALATEHGTTTVADSVVSKIAGIAARDVSGVHGVGGGAARAIDSIRERIPGGSTNYSQGVGVEVGQSEAAVDLDIVAEYGVAIAEMAEAVRRNVITSIERMTGLSVTEVNIAVNDVWLPEDDQDPSESQQPRVQ